jgi:hypothetical protein
VTPALIPSGSTQTVTIKGTNYASGVTVSANLGTVGAVTLVNSGQLNVSYNGPTSGGTVTFTITNTDGGGTTTTATVQSLPTLSGINYTNPSGVLYQKIPTVVSLGGTNFVSGMTVTLSDGSTCANVSVSASNAATCNLTDNAATGGTPSFTVTNPDLGKSAALTSPVAISKAPAPTVSSVTASPMGHGASTSVTITGTGFLPGDTLTLSNFGSGNNYTLTSFSSTQIVLSATAGNQNSKGSVTFVNADGQGTSPASKSLASAWS